MELSDEEKLRRLEMYRLIWPNVQVDEKGEVWIPFTIDLSDCIESPKVGRTDWRRPRPSSDDLPGVVSGAQSVITFNGGRPSQPAPKRQHIDELSYSYGLLWGVACALNCSLREVLDKLGTPTKKRARSTRDQR
jgi:hypothetical protein